MPARRALFAVLCVALALMVTGCATNAPQIPPGAPCETKDKTPFYKYGPAQSFGADEVLPPGTRVTMIERGFGFHRVMQANGVTGFVPSEDIQPIAPEAVTRPVATASARGTGSKRKSSERAYSGPIKRSEVQSTPGDPLFDINDVPLPMTDPVKPAFRNSGPKSRPNEDPKPE